MLDLPFFFRFGLQSTIFDIHYLESPILFLSQEYEIKT